MSFGVGISDILNLLQLAKDTVQSCRAAPSLFVDASRVSESVVNLFESVEIEYQKTSSPLHHDDRTRTDFAIHFRNCQNSMQPLADYISKYSSLGTSQIKLTDRFMFSKKTYVELRQNLAFYTARMSEFLQMIGLGALGRIEKKVGDVKDFLPQVMNKLDQMCAEVRIIGDKESLLSEHPDDEKHVWKAFRSRLIQAGYNSNILQQCQAEIFLRIRELTDCGVLESDAARSTLSEDEPLQRTTQVYQMPMRPKATSDGFDRDDESTQTLTARRSRGSLRSKKSGESIKSMGSRRPPDEKIVGSKSSRGSLRSNGNVDQGRPLQRRRTVPAVQQPFREVDVESSHPRAALYSSTPRIWRNPKGEPILKATFVAVDGDFVALRDTDGEPLQVPLSNLSEADVNAAQAFRNRREESLGEKEAREKPGIGKARANRKDLFRANEQLSRAPQEDLTLRGRTRDKLETEEVMDVPRRTKPEILVGKRTNQALKWSYRSEQELPSSKYSTGSITNDDLPKAAADGRLDKVKSLLRSGRNIEATGPKSWTEYVTTTDSEGNSKTTTVRHSYPETTALYRAAYAGHFKVAHYLLRQGAHTNTRDQYDGNVGELILFKTIRNGYGSMSRLLLEYEARLTDDFNYNFVTARKSGATTALQVACEYPKCSIVRLLLDYSADIDVFTVATRESPLYIASVRGFASTVELLLGEGAKVNTLTREGVTPLYKACGRGHGDVTRHLLRYGADPALGRGRQGETAMYRAAWENHLDVVDYLLDFEADVNIRNEKKMREYRDVAEKIVHGVLAGLSKDHALMNTWSKMPLHAAAYQGHRQMVELLLEAGADIEAMGNDEMTPLYLAAQQKNKSTVKTLLRAGAQLETERHDPVLALIDERNKGRNANGSRSQQLTVLEEHRRQMERAGTGDFLVGLVAQVANGISRSRRGTL